ncbi:GntR family transcriptional regulator [Aeromonas enteropelogenes]|uniref:GntR family transcriptional regulator n=1 Tax=Aeromonas enteropelogenes TaxID=29489 RepID=UPI0031352B23
MNNSTPLYITIKNVLEERILGAFYQDKIEGELSLAKEFGVARGTIKQAIDELVNEKLLIKKRGLGTFINNQLVTNKALDFPDFLSQGAFGSQVVCEMLNVLPVNATFEVAESMALSVGAPLFKVERQYKVGKQKIAFSASYFDANLFPNICTLHFNVPLYEQLRTIYGKAPVRLSEIYDYGIASATDSLALELPNEPTVITKICRRSFDISNCVIDYSEIICLKRAFELKTNFRSIHHLGASQYNSDIQFL